MIVIIASLLGAFLGIRNARRRGGNKMDIAQYAIGYAIAFALVGFILTIAIEKLI